MYGHTCSKSMDQPGKVANPVHGQLNREKLPCPRSRLRIWFRETSLAVPSRARLFVLYTNAESDAYSRDSLRTDGVHCRESVGTGRVVLKVFRVTGAAFASPWTKCSCTPLFFHTHYWYTVSMFKLSEMCKNISAYVLLYCFVEPFFPSNLWPVQA